MNRRSFICIIGITAFIFLMIAGCSEKEDNNYTVERLDLELRMKNSEPLRTDPPENYELQATVTHKTETNAERLIYELLIRNPKIDMKNLVMSFSLAPRMLPLLDTSDIFVTNLLNDKPLDFSLDSMAHEVSLSRDFVLKQPILAADILPIYNEIYVKISYTSHTQRITDYYKLASVPTKDTKKFFSK